MKFVHLFAICLSVSSCKHLPIHEIEVLPDDCTLEYQLPFDGSEDSLETCNCGIFPCDEIYVGGIPYDVLSLVFNPTNLNQAAFVRSNSTFPPTYELFIFDFCTRELTKLDEGVDKYIDWSVNNELLYEMLFHGPLKKYDANSHETTILMQETSYHLDPKWSTSGDYFVYGSSAENPPMILDRDGNAVDTLVRGAGSIFWQDSLHIIYGISASSSQSRLEKYNIATREKTELGTYPNNLYGNIAPAENGDIYIRKLWSLSRFNVITGEVELLRETQNINEWYVNMNVTPNRKEIIIVKQKKKYVSNCYFDSEFSFMIMDSNGGNPRILDIPQE